MFDCWGTKPIMDGDTIKGVIFESKAGRQAVYAKIVIDCTGDGDIYSQAGAPFHGKDGIISENQRDNQTALVWRAGNVDCEGYELWKKDHPDLAKAFTDELKNVAGYFTLFFPGGSMNTVWFNNWINGMNCTDLDDIRNTQLMVRNSIRRVLAYCKEALPMFFKDAYLMDIAPQLGTRCSRRLDGEVFRLDDAFHVAVNELGGNEMVNKISNTVRMLTHAMRYDSVKHMLESGRAKELYRAHERIYRILKERDEEDLERKVRSTYFVNGESLEPGIN